jgi:acetyl esterase/lipase
MFLLSATLAGLLTGHSLKPGSAAVRSLPNITYRTVSTEKLQLDLYLPGTPGPHPCVICFHGGAWVAGNRKDLTRPALFNPGGRDAHKDLGILENLARQGFAAASVSYRLAPKNKFPAQIEDAKSAVKFLRANAKKYEIDPDRFSALGFSAGAHLALLLGVTDSSDGFEGTELPEVSSRVQCVIDFFGPTDMSLYADTEGVVHSFMVPFLGKACLTDPTCYRRASPIEYVSKDDPPILMIHGTVDLVVPIIHSERMLKKLKESGVEANLVPVKWKGHGWEGEAVKESARVSLEFLNKHLKNTDKK